MEPINSQFSSNEVSERLKTHYAPEVETALVSLVWHRPGHLAQVLRELDPSFHFVQPYCRHILEAVRIVYSDLGAAVDWSSVVQTLREQKLLEEAGNLQLLDEVYRYSACPSLLNYYIELLRDFAEQRNTDPTQPVFRFTGGSARLVSNPARVRRRETDPDFVGTARVAGKNYKVRCWVPADGRSANLKLTPVG